GVAARYAYLHRAELLQVARDRGLCGDDAIGGEQVDDLPLTTHRVSLEQRRDAMLALRLRNSHTSALPSNPIASAVSSSVRSNDGARRIALSLTALTTRPSSRARAVPSLARGPSSCAASSSPRPRASRTPGNSRKPSRSRAPCFAARAGTSSATI